MSDKCLWPWQVTPFILRRTKDAVLGDLPPKIIQDVLVDPSPLQRRLMDEFARSPATQDMAASLGAGPAEGGVEAAAEATPHMFQVQMCKPMVVINACTHSAAALA